MRPMVQRIIGLAILACLAGLSCAPVDREVVLFQDDLARARRGPLSTDVGAYTEYHYLPEAAPKGSWSVSNDLGWWSVREAEGKRWLFQTGTNDLTYAQPMLIAGDCLWGNYRVQARFRLESKDHQAGIVFRYQNDQCYYFLGVQGSKAILKVVNHGTGFHQLSEKVLAQSEFSWQPGDCLTADIVVQGKTIRARLNDLIRLEATDTAYPSGKIGLTADGPTGFTDVKVTTTPASRQRYEAARKAFDDVERNLQAANPRPVVWKKIRTEGFGVGRNLRFGDLDNDGVIDVLIGQVLHHGSKDRNSELSCLTAMTLEGKTAVADRHP
jgi:rhamnogalacturonan endolyase